LSAATYQIFDESHTMGNTLRWMIMKKYVLPLRSTLQI
jgi:DNA-directed RNA polymerase I and III subunit RPAC2